MRGGKSYLFHAQQDPHEKKKEKDAAVTVRRFLQIIQRIILLLYKQQIPPIASEISRRLDAHVGGGGKERPSPLDSASGPSSSSPDVNIARLIKAGCFVDLCRQFPLIFQVLNVAPGENWWERQVEDKANLPPLPRPPPPPPPSSPSSASQRRQHTNSSKILCSSFSALPSATLSSLISPSQPPPSANSKGLTRHFIFLREMPSKFNFEGFLDPKASADDETGLMGTNPLFLALVMDFLLTLSGTQSGAGGVQAAKKEKGGEGEREMTAAETAQRREESRCVRVHNREGGGCQEGDGKGGVMSEKPLQAQPPAPPPAAAQSLSQAEATRQAIRSSALWDFEKFTWGPAGRASGSGGPDSDPDSDTASLSDEDEDEEAESRLHGEGKNGERGNGWMSTGDKEGKGTEKDRASSRGKKEREKEGGRGGPRNCVGPFVLGGRFLLAVDLQQNGQAPLRALSLGRLSLLLQGAVEAGLLAYENNCLKPAACCKTSCEAEWWGSLRGGGSGAAAGLRGQKNGFPSLAGSARPPLPEPGAGAEQKQREAVAVWPVSRQFLSNGVDGPVHPPPPPPPPVPPPTSLVHGGDRVSGPGWGASQGGKAERPEDTGSVPQQQQGQEHGHARSVIRSRLAKLFDVHRDGLCMSQVPQVYENLFGETLSVQVLGYTKLKRLIETELSDLCRVVPVGVHKSSVVPVRDGVESVLYQDQQQGSQANPFDSPHTQEPAGEEDTKKRRGRASASSSISSSRGEGEHTQTESTAASPTPSSIPSFTQVHALNATGGGTGWTIRAAETQPGSSPMWGVSSHDAERDRERGGLAAMHSHSASWTEQSSPSSSVTVRGSPMDSPLVCADRDGDGVSSSASVGQADRRSSQGVVMESLNLSELGTHSEEELEGEGAKEEEGVPRLNPWGGTECASGGPLCWMFNPPSSSAELRSRACGLVRRRRCQSMVSFLHWRALSLSKSRQQKNRFSGPGNKERAIEGAENQTKNLQEDDSADPFASAAIECGKRLGRGLPPAGAHANGGGGWEEGSRVGGEFGGIDRGGLFLQEDEMPIVAAFLPPDRSLLSPSPSPSESRKRTTLPPAAFSSESGGSFGEQAIRVPPGKGREGKGKAEERETAVQGTSKKSPMLLPKYSTQGMRRALHLLRRTVALYVSPFVSNGIYTSWTFPEAVRFAFHPNIIIGGFPSHSPARESPLSVNTRREMRRSPVSFQSPRRLLPLPPGLGGCFPLQISSSPSPSKKTEMKENISTQQQQEEEKQGKERADLNGMRESEAHSCSLHPFASPIASSSLEVTSAFPPQLHLQFPSSAPFCPRQQLQQQPVPSSPRRFSPMGSRGNGMGGFFISHGDGAPPTCSSFSSSPDGGPPRYASTSPSPPAALDFHSFKGHAPQLTAEGHCNSSWGGMPVPPPPPPGPPPPHLLWTSQRSPPEPLPVPAASLRGSIQENLGGEGVNSSSFSGWGGNWGGERERGREPVPSPSSHFPRLSEMPPNVLLHQ
uniref:HTH OST-type domain-containing protein n=1 Tax=Chromera velia CCMP2878 TaxID=1169474 RepID=A0A0G4HVY5_9ALVE|eukprot:Cvel_8927.t1-p1 / transcript=Cvel_8927.t1 / gene=Cvel_8927 / organism=Chromera_velia_CCMP2878 / gene_product=hypothetical protein / transcript_product=hypothetical protein / location=Cvel_scaffold502:60328-66777(-) / protein_length=1491 / sequence_SO=supercontig / SO=protein_coding / is_pseudo=false